MKTAGRKIVASLHLVLAVAAGINVAVSVTATAFIQVDKAPVSQPAVKKEVVSGQAQNPMPAARVKTPLVGAEASLDYAQPELNFQKGDSLPVPPSAGDQSSAVKSAGPSKPIGVATATTCNGGGGLWSSPASWSTGIVPTAAAADRDCNGGHCVERHDSERRHIAIRSGRPEDVKDVTVGTAKL